MNNIMYIDYVHDIRLQSHIAEDYIMPLQAIDCPAKCITTAGQRCMWLLHTSCFSVYGCIITSGKGFTTTSMIPLSLTHFKETIEHHRNT